MSDIRPYTNSTTAIRARCRTRDIGMCPSWSSEWASQKMVSPRFRVNALAETKFIFFRDVFPSGCLWHIADVQLALMNVRFEGTNGHDADVTRCRLMTQSGQSERPHMAFTAPSRARAFNPIDYELAADRTRYRDDFFPRFRRTFGHACEAVIC